MATRKAHNIPVELAQAGHNWDRWRQQQPRQRTKIPESFWTEAVQLAQKYGVAQTARVLRLHFGRLKQLVAARTPGVSAEAPPEFLEWIAPAAVRGPDCVLELDARHGGKLRLEFKGLPSAELAKLVRALITE